MADAPVTRTMEWVATIALSVYAFIRIVDLATRED